MLKHFSFNRKVFSYAARLLLGCGIVWQTAPWLHLPQVVWALVSVIIVSEPDFDTVRATMRSRVINTLSGCAIGLLFIYVAGANEWSLMAGVGLAVIISTSFRKYPSSWKLAPVTVVIVMIHSVTEHSTWQNAELTAVERTLEVLYGSSVAFVLGWLSSILMKRIPVLVHDENKNNTHE